MLRQISLSSRLPLPDSPLIKANWLRTATTVTKLEHQAKIQTQRTLRDAAVEAGKLRSEAWIEGYSEGIQCALQTVIHYIDNIESVTSRLLLQSQQQLEEQLRQLFANESCIENMLALLAHHMGREKITARKAIISFPAHAARAAVTIRNNFQQCGIEVELRTSPLEELRVEYGQEIWRCDFLRQSSQLAQLAIKATFEQQVIPEKLAEYRRLAQQDLAEKLAAGK